MPAPITTAAPPIMSVRRRRKYEKLTRAVLPELADVPLYFISPPDDFPKSEAIAFTRMHAIDAILYGEIERTVGWQGPGVLVVFCEKLPRIESLGITLHELAHGPYIVDRPEPPSHPELWQLMREIHRVMLTHVPDKAPDDALPPWHDGHGAQFIRKCCHLHARAWRAGYPIGLPEIHFAGFQYGVSAPWRYRWTLASEVKRMHTATMAEIENEPLPEDFLALWRDDVACWWRENQAESKSNTTENEDARIRVA